MPTTIRFEMNFAILLLPSACVLKTDFGDTDAGADSEAGDAGETGETGDTDGATGSDDGGGPPPEMLPEPHVLDWSTELEHGAEIVSDYVGLGIGPGGEIITPLHWSNIDSGETAGMAHRYTPAGTREFEIVVPMNIGSFFDDGCFTPDGRIYVSTQHLQQAGESRTGVVELSPTGDVLEVVFAETYEGAEELDVFTELVCDDTGKAWLAINTQNGAMLQAFDSGSVVHDLWLEFGWTRLDYFDGVLHVMQSNHTPEGPGETLWERRDPQGALLSSVVLPARVRDFAVASGMSVVTWGVTPVTTIAAFNEAGEEQWRTERGSAFDFQDIAVDPQGWSAISWYDPTEGVEGDFVSLLSPLGTEAWSLPLDPAEPGTVGYTYGLALEFDPQGGIVVAGGTTLQPSGEDRVERAWIARLAAP